MRLYTCPKPGTSGSSWRSRPSGRASRRSAAPPGRGCWRTARRTGRLRRRRHQIARTAPTPAAPVTAAPPPAQVEYRFPRRPPSATQPGTRRRTGSRRSGSAKPGRSARRPRPGSRAETKVGSFAPFAVASEAACTPAMRRRSRSPPERAAAHPAGAQAPGGRVAAVRSADQPRRTDQGRPTAEGKERRQEAGVVVVEIDRPQEREEGPGRRSRQRELFQRWRPAAPVMPDAATQQTTTRAR